MSLEIFLEVDKMTLCERPIVQLKRGNKSGRDFGKTLLYF